MKLKHLLLATAIGETTLSAPVIGYVWVVALGFLPLVLMFVLNIFTLVKCIEAKADRKGSIAGIVASLLGWVPILGWVANVVAAILLWRAYIKINTSTLSS